MKCLPHSWSLTHFWVFSSNTEPSGQPQVGTQSIGLIQLLGWGFWQVGMQFLEQGITTILDGQATLI